MERLFRSAIIFRIMSAFCMLGCFFFLITGIYKFVEGYVYFYLSITKGERLNPGVYIIEGLDAFMLALLFIIFAYGIYRIFILSEEENSKFPGWMHVHSFSELKLLLWETSIVTLIVFSVTLLVENETQDWKQLILPAVILMLSVAYFLTVRSKKH
jgi:uncharacterized membrane protein YqhA